MREVKRFEIGKVAVVAVARCDRSARASLLPAFPGRSGRSSTGRVLSSDAEHAAEVSHREPPPADRASPRRSRRHHDGVSGACQITGARVEPRSLACARVRAIRSCQALAAPAPATRPQHDHRREGVGTPRAVVPSRARYGTTVMR